jgi:hypothetical protein
MRKQFMSSLATLPLLIIDDFGMRKLPLTARAAVAASWPRAEVWSTQLANQDRAAGAVSRVIQVEKEAESLNIGPSPNPLGFSAFPLASAQAGRLRATPASNCVGAPVTSQCCRILRPGSVSLP